MKTETYTLPAFWASALVNGDVSGMEDDDERVLIEWLALHPELGGCLMCSEESEFCWHHDATPEVLSCDCLDFTFPSLQPTNPKETS